MSKSFRLFGVLLLLAVTAPIIAWAAPWDLHPIGFAAPALAHGNGNKIITGKFNTLHAVYENGLIIRYTTSADGTAWTAPVGLNVPPITGTNIPGRHPSIASDAAGNLGVIWVHNPAANGVGPLYYSYKTAAATTWTTVPLNINGAEPAMIGNGTSMHVAFTQIQMVVYATFPTLTPPGTLVGELLESTSCPATGFRKPAISLILDPCRPPIPRVAYLYYSDEQATSGGCQSLVTEIGPHVCQRNNTSATWSLIHSDVTTSSLASSTVEPLSLSMSSNFTTGNTFLAWSDVQNGVARTKLAHRNATTWLTSTFDAQRHHVHVRAPSASNAPATQFRFGWTGGGSLDEFFSAQTFWNTATWTGALPTWGSSVNLSSFGGLTGRPQTIFWGRCASGQYTTVPAYFEHEGVCASATVSIDLYNTSPCPGVGPIGPAYPCDKAIAYLASLRYSPAVGTPGTAIDMSELGFFTEVGPSSALVVSPNGRTFTVSWTGGVVIDRTDTTLTLSAPREAVAVRANDPKFKFSTVDLGYLGAYDGAREPGQGGGQCEMVPANLQRMR